MPPAERKTIKTVSWEQSEGFVSMESAYLYPPGSPLIVPGERITKEAVDLLEWYRDNEFAIEGLKTNDCIEVWTDG